MTSTVTVFLKFQVLPIMTIIKHCFITAGPTTKKNYHITHSLHNNFVKTFLILHVCSQHYYVYHIHATVVCLSHSTVTLSSTKQGNWDVFVFNPAENTQAFMMTILTLKCKVMNGFWGLADLTMRKVDKDTFNVKEAVTNKRISCNLIIGNKQLLKITFCSLIEGSTVA